jgi:alanyl-tRNA synthetase
VLNQTPFYGEAGGQVGDTGLLTADGVRFRVSDTQRKAGDLIVHFGKVEEGALGPGLALSLAVDHERRSDIRRNHSATHLLHESLRRVLGDHVAQKGSLVAPDRLRFDFSHPKPMAEEEIVKVEEMANHFVLANTAVTTRLMAADEAIASGARALFGEKYGEEVRVVAMGEAGNQMGWSIELCGGTHVARTGDIGLISVVSEGAVAAGVRRIEAMTGAAARRHLAGESRKLRELAALLKVPVGEIDVRLSQLVDERKRLDRDLAEAKKKLAMGGGERMTAQMAADTSNRGLEGVGPMRGVRRVGDFNLFTRTVSGVDLKDLRSLADEGKKLVGSGVVAIVALNEEGRAGIVVGVTADLTKRFDAVALVKKGAEALGGKGGGGRPDMAQAGGPDGSKAEAALEAIAAAIGAG